MATRVVVKDGRGNVIGERAMTQAERDVEAVRLASAAERLTVVLPGVSCLLQNESARLLAVRAAPAPAETP